jgi:hypothetical protein
MKSQTAMQVANLAETALRILPDTPETRNIRVALVQAANKSWGLYDVLLCTEDDEARNRVDSSADRDY